MRKLFYKNFKILVCLFILNAIIPQFAFAYLDPGTGSMVLQIVLASIIGIGCTFKSVKNKIISLFKFKKESKNNERND